MPKTESLLLSNKIIQLGLDVENAYIEINQELQIEFNKLYTFIIESIKKAKEQNKSFILLVGENHYSLQSFFFKNLLIDMMYQLGIKTIGYETTEEKLRKSYIEYNLGINFIDEYLIDRWFLPKVRRDLYKLNPQSIDCQKTIKEINKKKQQLVRDGQDGASSLFLRTINYIEKKQMKLIPIDDPSSQIHEYAISEDGIIKRDCFMSAVLSSEIDNANNNTYDLMAIVGAVHLYGMSNHLKEKYFVLTIDTIFRNWEASIFIDKKDQYNTFIGCTNQDATFKVEASGKFINSVFGKVKNIDYCLYTPSRDFFISVQRESLKVRAILGIPRTLYLIFNKAKLVCKKSETNISCVRVPKSSEKSIEN